MDDRQNLEILDSVLWLHTRNAYTAIATKHFLYWQYYGWSESEREEVYQNHPSNTHFVTANEALIYESVVSAYEYIASYNKSSRLLVPQEDVEALRKLRHVISHGAKVKFRDPAVQDFYTKGGKYRDPAAQRLWRIRQGLLEQLTSLGSDRETKLPNEVVVQLGTCELIHSTMCLVYKDEIPKPNFDETKNLVFDFFRDFQSALINSISFT